MRLHSLTLQAFGPFPGRESIDFDALDQGILLVNGPTGSGKSSLLDAITFALFGDVAGTRRSLRQSLRSHHAPPEREPSVELVFSIAATRWRIRRVPQWEAPKRRGGGTTTRHAHVELSQGRVVDGVGAWHLISARIDEAAEMIRETLGMGLDQFAQVVLLPQGEFAEFLRAKPEDRRTLLERLFDVERFEAVERWFTETKNDRVKASENSLAGISSKFAVVTDTLSRLQDAEFETPVWEAAEVAELPATMRELLRRLRVRSETALREAERDAAQSQTAERALERAATLLEDQSTHSRALEQLDRWPDDEITELAARIEAATSVSSILKLSKRCESAEREAKLSCSHWQGCVESVETLTGSELSGQRPVEEIFPTAQLEETDALFHRFRQLIERLADDVSTAHRAIEAHKAALVDLTRAQAHFDECETQTSATRSALEKAEEQLTQSPQVTHQIEDVDDVLTGVARARVLITNVASAQEASTQATNTYLAAERTVVHLRAARLAGMAAELAGDLEDGSPCPVCGSCTHPAPTPRDQDSPTAEAITAAEENVQKADRARLEKQSVLASAESASTTFRGELQVKLDDVLADATKAGIEFSGAMSLEVTKALESTETLAQIRRAYEARAQQHRSAQETLVAARKASDESQQKLNSAQARLSSARARSAAAEEESTRTTDRRNRAREAVVEQSSAFDGTSFRPPPIPDLSAAEQPIDEVMDALEQAIKAVDKAHRHHRTVQRAVRALAAASESYEAAQRRAEAERTDLEDELTAKGYDDLEQARSVALEAEELDELQATWQSAVEARASALATIKEQRVAASAFVPRPDEASLRQRAQLLSRQAAGSRTTAATWANATATVSSMRDSIADAVRAYLPLVSAAEEMQELAQTFSGNGENTHRMRLTSYVLAAHLETVTAMANDRLHHMTDGRYQLQYTDERAKGNQRSGLGLLVVDAWTGRSRDTSTLSGGEAFMASLALALGLGDAVRADSGGMELHTLFVDEGFGSLDQDTLEQVMEVLDGLREGGRLVGVVSHVSELRARIPTRIEVRKTSEGSTVHTESAQIPVSAPS